MAKTNRLHLDFSLSTSEERKAFLEQYLQSDVFRTYPPDEDELATMADYLLWGKNSDGLNGKQQGLELHSKHKTWDDSPVDSLDQLMEQPMFNEASLSALGTTHFRTKKEVFSREEALASASPLVQQSFLSLFSRIDELDFMIEEWELNHNKRTKPIRAELLKKFDEDQLRTMRERITHWNQYKYLKMRHELVELRREQYTLRDSYRKIMFTQDDDAYAEPAQYDFDAGIEVLPLGVKHDGLLQTEIFRAWRELHPGTVSEESLPLISKLYWQKKEFKPSANQMWIDFREPEHVYQLLNNLAELTDAAIESDAESNLPVLLKTLQFYVDGADLPDLQKEILDMKLRKIKNVDIAWDINKKYGKSYTQNYISTIFRQRIIPKICDAAKYHEEIIANIFFPENFKECSCCGETMLRSADNFTRKSRASDGLSARCKKCEKKARQGE